MYCLGMNSYS